ncbi:transposase, partial [Streptomyces avermitilis]|uniref:transposase n=1 Tax=Streptomyces avermitilis TaxID=33903 RepID=UPI0033A06853
FVHLLVPLRRVLLELAVWWRDHSAAGLGSESTAASVSDNVGGIHLLSRIATSNPQVRKGWTDTGYRTKAIDHGTRLGIDVEAVRRDPAAKGFKVIPRRWVVERTFGWLMRHRRLAHDYETHPHRSEAMIRVAMIDLISRRLTCEPP